MEEESTAVGRSAIEPSAEASLGHASQLSHHTSAAPTSAPTDASDEMFMRLFDGLEEEPHK